MFSCSEPYYISHLHSRFLISAIVERLNKDVFIFLAVSGNPELNERTTPTMKFTSFSLFRQNDLYEDKETKKKW